MSAQGDVSDDLRPLRATIVEYENKPTECTIHPVDPPSDRQSTAWITAKEGAYVPLASWR